MKFKRATIYKRYHANTSISYMIVLNVHKRGMSFVYLTEKDNNKFYNNIDGLYIDDIGSCVSIDRILYLDWSKIISKHYEKYRELSGREIRKITTAIKDLYDGIISYDKYGIMIYTDIESEAIDADVEEEPKQVVVKKEETITETTIVESKTVTSKSTSTVEEILLDNGIPVETADNDNKHEKYIDLLDYEHTQPKGKKSSVHNSSTQRSKNKLNRHMFSESEALAITTMSISEVIQKYGVSKSTANVMKRNANKYFGFKNGKGNNTGIDHSGITELLRQGLTIEQIASAHPEYKIDTIRSCYHSYCITRINKTASIDDLQREILEEGSVDDFIEIDGMTYKQFCTKYKCSLSVAKTIKVAIRNILSKNIYFAIFGAEAYGDLNIRIKNASQNSARNRVDIANFNTCTRLKNIYEATYDDHFDIITGSKPLPESLRGKDRERFMGIIKQRCNERVYDRTYTIDQLHMIDKHDVEGLASILVINYSKAFAIMSRKGSSTSNGGGG